ncbi:MAG: aminotransferase class V-fold PLP-dependent enzyme [Streptosporangiales bacterium]|nr:aminotransferase class V-fold PLP-dependent enzyme [Streptosporangiales bacterium]
MTYQSGRHFLQIPGPTNVPGRVLRAMSAPTIDHRGPEFADLAREVLAGVARLCGTGGPVALYPSSGTGAWEAALANTLSPGDRVLAFDIGHFAALWTRMATQLGLDVDVVEGDWRRGVQPEQVYEKLAADPEHRVKAVLVVQNETSTGAATAIPLIREAIDRAGHPALLLVDAVSSLGSIDYRHDEWGVDVTVAGSQKGMMLPPGLALNAISPRALEASRTARLPRSYWDWKPLLGTAETGAFPYTPPTNLLFGLREALAMLDEEGLPAVWERHARFAEAARRAVRAWGLDLVCQDPDGYSPTLTAVMVPDGHDADQVRKVILDRFDMSLGTGLGRLAGKVFRIGHLGDLNDLTLAGALCGVEMGLTLAGVPIAREGVTAALDYLASAV